MFCAVELARSQPANKRSRFLPNNNVVKLYTRRILSQFILSRRLTFLLVWSLIVIYFLYKALSSSLSLNLNQEHHDQIRSATQELPLATERGSIDQLISYQVNLEDDHDDSSASKRRIVPDKLSRETKSHHTSSPEHNQPASTSTRKPSSDYARSCKIFILIVRDHEDARRRATPNFSTNDLRTTWPKSRRADTSIKIHNYIRSLIEILDAHRIEYAIDTIGSGLPETLLADQGDKQKFPIIVIDDFIKYTRLNRWARDQLDRHCKTNGIGVISYLKNDGAHVMMQRQQQHQSARSKATDIADQEFPLTFTRLSPPTRHSANQKCPRSNSSSTSCLLAHKLNQNSPILRVIKRKSDIESNADFSRNQDADGAWTSLSSNHVSYEPIAWAQYKTRPVRKADPDQGLATNQAPDQVVTSSTTSARDTQNRDQRSADQVQTSFSSDGLNLDPSQQTNPTDYVVAEYEDQLAYVDPKQLSDDGESDFESKSAHETSSLVAEESISSFTDGIDWYPLSMYDRGLYDGIKRVIFGGFNQHWLNRLILLDSIEHLSAGRILSPLERYVQIDIDDIFVGERGIRMKRDDVDALLEMQTRFAERIHGGFKFNLGFSGKYFKRGSNDENLADEYLVEQAKQFTWFCHFWSHAKAHLLNSSKLIANELELNLDFARRQGLPIIGQPADKLPDKRLFATYAVAPHHSGGKYCRCGCV